MGIRRQTVEPFIFVPCSFFYYHLLEMTGIGLPFFAREKFGVKETGCFKLSKILTFSVLCEMVPHLGNRMHKAELRPIRTERNAGEYPGSCLISLLQRPCHLVCGVQHPFPPLVMKGRLLLTCLRSWIWALYLENLKEDLISIRFMMNLLECHPSMLID